MHSWLARKVEQVEEEEAEGTGEKQWSTASNQVSCTFTSIFRLVNTESPQSRSNIDNETWLVINFNSLKSPSGTRAHKKAPRKNFFRLFIAIFLPLKSSFPAKKLTHAMIFPWSWRGKKIIRGNWTCFFAIRLMMLEGGGGEMGTQKSSFHQF